MRPAVGTKVVVTDPILMQEFNLPAPPPGTVVGYRDIYTTVRIDSDDPQLAVPFGTTLAEDDGWWLLPAEFEVIE